MRAVSNTSPLSNLAIIGRLHLLERQFEGIIIPDAVDEELALHLGIEVRGVLGILLRGKFAGDLAAIRPEIESLETQAGFRIAPALRQQILQAAGE